MGDKPKHTPGNITAITVAGEAVSVERLIACYRALEGWADPSAAGEVLEAAEEKLQFLKEHQTAAGWGDMKRLRAAIAKVKGE